MKDDNEFEHISPKIGFLWAVVKERGTERLMKGIKVKVPHLKKSVITDKNGEFKIENVLDGEYKVVILNEPYKINVVFSKHHKEVILVNVTTFIHSY